MSMVPHVVDGDWLLPLSCDDSGYVLLQLVVMGWINQILSAFHSEHNLNVNLGVGVGHERIFLFGWRESIKMGRLISSLSLDVKSRQARHLYRTGQVN